MSTRFNVRREVEYLHPAFPLDFEDLVETGGIAFPDGHCIELIKDDVGSLTFFDSKSKEFLDRIDLAGQTYVPPTLAPSMLEALTVPTKRTDCGSTVEMFAQIRNFFLDCGVSEDAAQASTYFALATWFPEFLPVAPFLVITGPESEARVFLQLLTGIVRHALPLAEINVATFHRLPMHLQPTLLIGYVHPSMWRVFSQSNYPQTLLPDKNGLTDLYSAKAAYAGSVLGGVAGDAILNISCPYGGKLPAINGATKERVAADFQPKLLDYRLKHVVKVREADFDAPTLPTPLRMLARALGSCIVGAPELQAGIARLLESQGDVLRANHLIDLNCVAIEAMLAHCHGEDGPTRVGVSEIATTATAILADRGETTALESKRIGSHLRLLGFRAKRDGKGFAIHLTADVRRLIHRLARDHRVGDSEQGVPGCPDCTELMSAAQTGKSNP
jgi:hypothetical protein